MSRRLAIRATNAFFLLALGSISAWAQGGSSPPITNDVRVIGEVWADSMRLGQARIGELAGAPASGLVVYSPSSYAAIALAPAGASYAGLQLDVSPSGATLWTKGSQPITLSTQNSPSLGLILDSQGNVQLTGSITIAGSATVQSGSFIASGQRLNVPDYVFEDGFSLRPLDELRAFIQREKHLPDIPNAEEIKADGLDLSEFQMRLLKKIEELTLYTLAQQQEIDELEEAYALLCDDECPVR